MMNNIILISMYPFGNAGLAPYYLKTYYMKKNKTRTDYNIKIKSYHVNEDESLIINEILSEEPKIIGASCYIWNTVIFLRILKEVSKLIPDVKIILGGPDVAPVAEKIAKENEFIDVISTGEGEITFHEVVNHYIYSERSIDSILGIVYRCKDEVIVNGKRPLIQDMNEIPSPFIENVIELDKLNGYLCSFETYRGCPFGCHYCYWGKTKNVRYFPIERIQNELLIILNSPVKRVWFSDAAANLNAKRFKQLLKFILEVNSSTVIDFEMMAEILDEETIELLGQLKGGYTAFGLQSMNKKTLLAIGRNLNKEKYRENIKKLRWKTDKVKIYIDLIYGLPEDNYSTFEHAIKYAFSLLPHRIQAHPLIILPGSKFHDEPQKYSFLVENNPPYYVRENSTFSRYEMEKASAWVNKLHFYFNPAVNTAIVLLNQVLNNDEPFVLFERLLIFIYNKIDINEFHFGYDVGIDINHVLKLNEVLMLFINKEFDSIDKDKYAKFYYRIIDVVKFYNLKTLFYNKIISKETKRNNIHSDVSSFYPSVNSSVLIESFNHNISMLYTDNILTSLDKLSNLSITLYTLVFNLETHSIYYISEYVKELLILCSGKITSYEIAIIFCRKFAMQITEESLTRIIHALNEMYLNEIINLSECRF